MKERFDNGLTEVVTVISSRNLVVKHLESKYSGLFIILYGVEHAEREGGDQMSFRAS